MEFLDISIIQKSSQTGNLLFLFRTLKLSIIIGTDTTTSGNVMALRKVPREQILRDIRSGMDEAALCQKYGISIKGLENVYQKLIETGLLGADVKPIRRKVNIAAVLADIRAGMSKSALMEKYGLSEETLQQATRKLLDARGIRPVSDGPETTIEEPLDFLATLEFARHKVNFEIPIYEANQPEIHGVVRDISEQSVSVAGIEANAGDVKTLVILSDEFGEFSSFEFKGVCLWSSASAEDRDSLAGFAISNISQDALRQLQKLLRVISVAG